MKKGYLLGFLLMIGLSCNAPINGMFTRLRANVVNWRVAGRSSNSSTLSGRFKSWLQSFQRQPLQTSPFEAGGQIRSFSTTPVQQISFREKIGSLFNATSPEEKFIGDFSEIVGRESSEKEYLGGVVKVSINKSLGVFSKENCDRAKKIIEQNKAFINARVKSYYYVGEGQTLPRGIKINKLNSPSSSESALDIVMRNWFSFILRDYNPAIEYNDLLAQQIINYLDLAKYIVDRGGQLGMLTAYKKIHSEMLMPYYRSLNGGDPNSIEFYSMDSYQKNQAKIMQQIFEGFDYILMKLSDDDYKKYLGEAAKERELIDQDPNAYREKVYSSASSSIKKEREKIFKDEYLKAKKKRKENLWRWANNMHDMDEDYRIPKAIKQEWANVDFIEDEYLQWLKNKTRFNNFHYGSRESYKSRADAEREDQDRKSEEEDILGYKGEPIWKELSKYGLTEKSTNAEIKSAYHKFAKEYRPDLPTEDKEKAEYIQKVNAAWDAYNEQLKNEKEERLKKEKEEQLKKEKEERLKREQTVKE